MTEATKDYKLMKQLANETKLDPNDRIKKTNDFLKLLVETKKKEGYDKSSKDKSELYGIEVKPFKKKNKNHITWKKQLLKEEMVI